MIDVSFSVNPTEIQRRVQRVAETGQHKIRLLAGRWNPAKGSPVFTKQGAYTSQGWTEWTQGFQFGAPLLAYEITGEPWFLEYGRASTLQYMAVHLTHRGVHDHGFNNISTYGNLLRLARAGKLEANPWEEQYYALALRVSGAVQASRWKDLPEDLGYIYSFNGPQSLFADTIRSLRSLAQAYLLGQTLMEEQDAKINLLRRLLQHAETTARYIVYYGKGRDQWDVRGRTAHEAIFNPVNGSFRNPSTQQGYSPFSCWTRGLAWVLLGFAEELEFLHTLEEGEVEELGLPYFPSKQAAIERFLEVATATADFYLQTTPPDGVPYWDTGAPNLREIDLSQPADPLNPHEPVDSSAAAIAAQGLLRLGLFVETLGKKVDTSRPPYHILLQSSPNPYIRAGLRTAFRLMEAPYLCEDPLHEGLLLHAVYHRPRGWDYVPPGASVPNGESCMWGDYHLLELAVYLNSLCASPILEGTSREKLSIEPYRFFVKGGDNP